MLGTFRGSLNIEKYRCRNTRVKAKCTVTANGTAPTAKRSKSYTPQAFAEGLSFAWQCTPGWGRKQTNRVWRAQVWQTGGSKARLSYKASKFIS